MPRAKTNSEALDMAEELMKDFERKLSSYRSRLAGTSEAIVLRAREKTMDKEKTLADLNQRLEDLNSRIASLGQECSDLQCQMQFHEKKARDLHGQINVETPKAEAERYQEYVNQAAAAAAEDEKERAMYLQRAEVARYRASQLEARISIWDREAADNEHKAEYCRQSIRKKESEIKELKWEQDRLTERTEKYDKNIAAMRASLERLEIGRINLVDQSERLARVGQETVDLNLAQIKKCKELLSEYELLGL